MSDIFQSWLDEKDNYLLRIVGVENQHEYVKTIRRIADQAIVFYGTIDTDDENMTQKIRSVLEKMDISSLKNGEAVEELSKRGFFYYIKNQQDVLKIKTAFNKILVMYFENKLAANKLPDSAKMNTAISFVSYLMSAIKQHVRHIDGQKVVCLGDFKTTEAYFINLLSLAGYKVVYFNGENDLAVYYSNSKVYNYEKSSVRRYLVPESEEEKYDNIKNELLKSSDIFYDLTHVFEKATDVYEENGYKIIPHYFYRIIGVKETTEIELYSFVNKYVELKNALKKNKGFRFMDFSKEANRLTSNSTHKNAIKKLASDAPDFEALVEQIDKCGIVIDIKIRVFFKKALAKTFSLMKKYCAAHKELDVLEYINTLIHLIIRDEAAINQVLTSKVFIMSYGSINEVGAFYLYFLSLVGFNVLYISLDKKFDAIFKELEKEEPLSYLDEYKNSADNMPFPAQKLVSRSTVAYSASTQLNDMLFNEATGMFKPFQFDDRQIQNICLKTTYDEISILIKEEARIRPSFGYDDQTIYIPNLFAKVNGVPENRNEYLLSINEIVKNKKTFFIYTKKPNIINNKFELLTDDWQNHALDSNGLLDFDKVVHSSRYKYGYTKISTQRTIIEKINILIKSNDIFSFTIDNEKRRKIVNLVLGMNNPKMAEMLHSFNYYADIPKIIIFNNIALDNETALNLSIALAFFNLIGFDIVLYCPTGYTDIERYLQSGVYVQHTLPNIDAKIEYRNNPPKTSRLFGLFDV